MPLLQLPLSQQKLARTLKLAKHRQAEGYFLVEGMTVIQEALNSGLVLEWIASSAAGRQRYPAISTLHVLHYDCPTLQQLSALQTVPDVVALVCLPKPKPLDLKAPVIYLDGIADPGNLGTMIRTGAWFGVTQWLLRDGGCDPYNPKVVRSAMGALFRSSTQTTVNPIAELTALKKKGYTLLATVPTGGDAPAKQVSPYCLLIGQEARGLEPELKALANQRLTIPGSGSMESLNAAVAFGIILHTVSSTYAVRT